MSATRFNASTTNVDRAPPSPRPAAPGDDACVAFLQWALPRAGLRWAGYRKVRRQVCRRLARRVAALGLPDLAAYRAHLDAHPAEWAELAALAPVTISRFARDRAVWDALAREVVPVLDDLARAGAPPARPRAWSAGCASGEEAYTLALLFRQMEVLATDVHPPVLERARRAAYPASSLRELTQAERETGFVRRGGEHAVRAEVAAHVTVAAHDLRREPPPRHGLELVLCRNVAFTYFAPDAQRTVLERLAAAVRPGGALVTGLHEALPDPPAPFEPWPGARAVYRRRLYG